MEFNLDVTDIGLDDEYFCCSEISTYVTQFAYGDKLRFCY
jgi:hypothetical protein